MSIHNLDLSPPIQTSEQLPSGEFSRDLLQGQLAAGVLEIVNRPELGGSTVVQLPDHDSVRLDISLIHEAKLPKISRRLAEVTQAIIEIDNELTRLAQEEQALQEYRDDLGMFGRVPANNSGRGADLSNRINIATQRRVALLEIRDKFLAKQTNINIKLERLEHRDFKLLRRGL